MRIHQIRTQLIIIIVCFLFLVIGSFSVSLSFIHEHDKEEIAQQIIRDHRITIQRLTWLSLIEPDNISIQYLKNVFETEINSMVSEGLLIPLEGDSYQLPSQIEKGVRSEYKSIAKIWSDYQSQLEIVIAQSTGNLDRTESWAALQSLERQIVQRLDFATEAYDNYISEQHFKIERLEIGFISLAIPLVIIGIYVIKIKIVQPLESLNKSANQIKNGDLLKLVPVVWEDEIGQLAQSMEAMRIEIIANKHSLEEKIAERTHELTIATNFSQEISRKLNQEEIFKSAILQAKNMLHADDVSFCLISEDGKCLQMVAKSSGLISGEKPEQPVTNQFASLFERDTQITNVANSPCKFLQADQDGSFLSSTLQAGEKVVGEMCVRRGKNRPFDENEIKAFSLLTNSAAIAIYNSQLVEISKNQVNQSARLEERQQLAAELHDDLAQNLGVSKMHVGQLINLFGEKGEKKIVEELEQLIKNLEIANEQVRRMISGLSANSKTTIFDLNEEMKTIVEEFQRLCDIPVIYDIRDSSWKNASILIQRQLLMILRESMANIRRHAKATSVQINVLRERDSLVLKIEDNGVGFDLEQTNEDGHFGLKIMNARANRSGGRLEIQSEPGVGTNLKVTFPFESESRAGILLEKTSYE